MRKSLKEIVTILFIVLTWSVLGQGMYYQQYGLTGTIKPQKGVKLSNGDYIFCGSDFANNYVSTIYSTAGWSIPIISDIGTSYLLKITSYNDTIYCAFTHDEAITIGGVTYPDPPLGAHRPIALMIASDGTILNSWEISGNSYVWGVSAKSGEFAVMGRAYYGAIQHLPPIGLSGGAYVLVNDLTSWNVNKGFSIDTEYIPSMHSIQYLSNGNLALAGETAGGDITFGGIDLTVFGGNQGFRGEITTSGVGISAIVINSYFSTNDNYQITMDDGSFMVTGDYEYSVSFYQSDGTLDFTLDTGNSIDQIYFAVYNSSGVFQYASCAYNHINEDLINTDIACNDSSFYSIIYNSEGGTVITPTGSHDREACVFLKFNKDGNPEWSKQYDGTYPSSYAYYIIDGDIVSIFGYESPSTDLDFNSGVVNLPVNSGYWAEYFDGILIEPTADFSGTPLNGDAPLNVAFTDMSIEGTFGISSWSWIFGDGGTSSNQDQNHTYTSPGSYTVTLTVSDGISSDTESKTNYITVTAPPPYLNIDPQSVTVNPAAANNVPLFAITSNESWTITTNDPLVTVTPSTGNGDQTINVSYPAINTLASETYTITITSSSNITKIFTITQMGVSEYITLDPDQANVPAIAGSLTFDISCPDDLTWNVTDLNDWVSANPLSGMGSETITLNYEENTEMSARTNDISISGGGVTDVFQITQVAAGEPLTIETTVNKQHFTVGETIEIGCVATGGTSSYTYDWTVSPTGNTSTQQNFSFISTTSEHYIATVTVNDGENTETSSIEFDVHEVTIDLLSSTQSAQVGDLIEFEITVNQESNDIRTIDQIQIYFGDGESETGYNNPMTCSHIYEISDAFNIEVSTYLSDGSLINIEYPDYIEISVGLFTISDIDIEIYPNPIINQLFINSKKTIEKLSIINIAGVEVLLKQNLKESTLVDFNSLPSGVYFLQIFSGGIHSTHKVVKR